MFELDADTGRPGWKGCFTLLVFERNGDQCGDHLTAPFSVPTVGLAQLRKADRRRRDGCGKADSDRRSARTDV